jgi:hypothetical protein
VLGGTAAIQVAIYLLTGSVALLAELIHNFGDALTAIPLAVAFFLRSGRAERWAGLAVVLAILISASSPSPRRSRGSFTDNSSRIYGRSLSEGLSVSPGTRSPLGSGSEQAIGSRAPHS